MPKLSNNKHPNNMPTKMIAVLISVPILMSASSFASDYAHVKATSQTCTDNCPRPLPRPTPFTPERTVNDSSIHDLGLSVRIHHIRRSRASVINSKQLKLQRSQHGNLTVYEAPKSICASNAQKHKKRKHKKRRSKKSTIGCDWDR